MLRTFTQAALANPSPDTLMIIACGTVSGMASMLLYNRLSPQERIQQLKAECASLQQDMASFDGDLAGAWALARENLQVSLRRLAVALIPSLWAGLPVLLALVVVREHYVAFFVATAVAAVATKFIFHVA